MSAPSKSRCPICGGKRKAGKVTFTVDLGSGVVVIRNVPATVCSQCGEDWLADEVSEQLAAMVDRAKKNGAQIEVCDFPKKAS